MKLSEEFDAALSAQERTLVERARTFARDRVAPNAAAWDRAGAIPRAAFRDGCAAGLGTVELPTARGGRGASFSTKVRVAEELAKVDLPFAFALINHHNAMARISDSGEPGLCDELLPAMICGDLIGCTAMTEAGAGSDFANISTLARKVTDGWVLDGRKDWVSNANIAGVVVTFTRTEAAEGARGIGCFVLRDTDAGFFRQPRAGMLGLGAMALGAITLQGCCVPGERLLYAPGEAFKQAMAGVNRARTHVAAMNAGMIEAALEFAIAHGRQRRAFGKRLVDHQGLAWKLADVATNLEALRLLTYRASRLIDSGADPQAAAAMAKKFAGETALTAIASCMQVMGANGLEPDLPLSRHLACAKATAFADGTIEMMNERIVRLLIAEDKRP